MSQMSNSGQDCWLTRVEKIEKLLRIPSHLSWSKTSGKKLATIVKSKFDRYWLDKINEFKTNKNDNYDHNKLRVYKLFKSSFTAEPYVTLVRNRNQRSSLTRLRISAHTLATELLRRTKPITPINQRFCAYCKTDEIAANKSIDTEQHFMVECSAFRNTRDAMFAKIADIIPGFKDFSDFDKFATLMCPTTPQLIKSVNRYIKSMFKKREDFDAGTVLGAL